MGKCAKKWGGKTRKLSDDKKRDVMKRYFYHIKEMSKNLQSQKGTTKESSKE